MENSQDEKIIRSWNKNASLWTSAVRSNAIESRHLVTNEAILNAVLSCGGKRILDAGCGEGWLSRALISSGKDVTGFDVSSDLIEQAMMNEPRAKFCVASYEKFTAEPHAFGTDFDVVVCNFSLLGDQLDKIFTAFYQITRPSGHVLIQTLHPCSSFGELPYEDGWREERFTSLQGQWLPMPWYFRTLNSWIRELTSAGWRISELKEPLHPLTGKPASLILHGIKSI
jgi:2-polyprenyl-3-methyl-5-hydroxy-6-metoxy-1,4-benzoquinol methylase